MWFAEKRGDPFDRPNSWQFSNPRLPVLLAFVDGMVATSNFIPAVPVLPDADRDKARSVLFRLDCQDHEPPTLAQTGPTFLL